MAQTVSLTGRLADITSKPVEEITTCTVKAPTYRPGPDIEITTSQPQQITLDEDGKITINTVAGIGWLYIEGPGWSESIKFVAAAGMTTLWEAVVNALGPNGMTDYTDALANAATKIDNYVDQKTSEAWAGLNSSIAQRPTLGVATSIAFGAAAASGAEHSAGAAPQWDASHPVFLWGDSAIDRGLAGDRLADYLDAALFQNVVDNAAGGTPIADTAFRMGVLPIYGSPAGGSIPAGTAPIEVKVHGMLIGFTHGAKHNVKWSGVKGTLTYYSGRFHESGIQKVEFVRETAGSSVPVESPQRIFPRVEPPTTGTHIVVSGGNDASKGYIQVAPTDDKASHIISMYSQIIESIPANPVRHVLIGGVKTRSTTMPGDENHKLVTTVNNQLKQLYPQHFVDRQRWLCERGPEILGLELTEKEKLQQAAGIIPARVFTDETHVGTEIRQAEARELWAWQLSARGWAQSIDGHIGYRMPMMATTVTAMDVDGRVDELSTRIR